MISADRVQGWDPFTRKAHRTYCFLHVNRLAGFVGWGTECVAVRMVVFVPLYEAACRDVWVILSGVFVGDGVIVPRMDGEFVAALMLAYFADFSEDDPIVL